MRFGVIAGAGGLLAIVIFAVVWGLSGDKTYEECMLNQMKGQAQNMWPTAHKHCARRHRLEQSVSVGKDDWAWLGIDKGLAHLVITKKTDEYALTRVDVRFSGKACEDAKTDADYERAVSGPITE